jgi:hypothetical protein
LTISPGHGLRRVGGVAVAWLGVVFWLVALPAFPPFVLTAIVLGGVAIDGPARPLAAGAGTTILITVVRG